MPHSDESEHITDIFNSKDKSHNVKGKKPDPEEFLQWASIYVKFKNKQKEISLFWDAHWLGW